MNKSVPISGPGADGRQPGEPRVLHQFRSNRYHLWPDHRGNSDNGYNFGGAIVNIGTLTITSSTFSGNPANSGGGIYNWSGSTLKIGHTIFNAGSSGENIYNEVGTVISLGYNLSSDNGGGYLTATDDRISTDPKLGPLQNNGGPPSRICRHRIARQSTRVVQRWEWISAALVFRAS